MDLSLAASLASYQYSQATQAGGQTAGLAQALSTAQSLASQTASLLPSSSGPAALLDLSPQAIELSALASAGGLTSSSSSVQALVQQAQSASDSATAALVGSPSNGFSDPTTSALLTSYQYLQAQQAGTSSSFLLGLENNAPSAINTTA